MPEMRDVRSVIDAAEQAAAGGDYASAERLLREAVVLQEANLGSLHPDLANTLNNLGVVCEITNKPIDAERCFRRAHEIATAVFAPDHPFVATSRKNLQDFCKARGKAVDLPAPPAPIVARPEAPVRASASGALVAGALLVIVIGAALWFRPSAEVAPPASAIVSASPPESVAPAAVPPPATTPPPPLPPLPPPAPPRKAAASAARLPVVATAQLCRDLPAGGRRASTGDWQCIPASAPVGPGPLFFYTRIESATDVTVQHRWYYDGRQHQAVELLIRANTTGGYRTFSRNTVNEQRVGEWRVELRTQDGMVLHEERFVVR